MKEKAEKYKAEIYYQKQMVLESNKVQEDERRKMAVMVHDDLGNRLNILSLWLNNIEIEDKSAEKVISTQISELIDSARGISHSLYPVNLERLGLILYIEELITNLSPKITILLKVNSKYTPKDVSTEVQIYRIIQEFTTNVIKHSLATEIEIYIKDNKKNTVIILSDNGQGFDYQTASKGMGLKNIESRIKSLNAIYKWKNTIGKRSRLIIKIFSDNEFKN
ncbi:sensor histidine kinase [Chryseobacterium oryctis]|uniref:histidine kinase n=1 Tax=Chryseobacterium oryctis TaxID=2952618 RepID=A0ABT3HJK5_9FLAO|nr:ATP-binding protein [Chryseobacterium oryctis]MCW3159966.1 histidine kinase [Chryseobacterium oryctis]